MKKLSELSKNTMLMVYDKHGNLITITDVEDFKIYKNDLGEVFVIIAEKEVKTFNLEKWLKEEEGNMHEDWVDYVLDYIDKDVIKLTEKIINNALECNPTYYPGENVDINS